MHKPEQIGDSGGGNDGLVDEINEKTNSMQLTDSMPVEAGRKISREETDTHDDADGEADDDDERYKRTLKINFLTTYLIVLF